MRSRAARGSRFRPLAPFSAAGETGNPCSPLSLGDRENMVFVGSNVAGGTGQAVVVATAMATELGRIAGLIEEGVAFNRELTGIIGTNLSQFRSNITKTNGNPITATEAEFRAADQAQLGKTQLNRYYTQHDWLYTEKYRRAVSEKIREYDRGGKAAKEFQAKCVKRGVPLSAMRKPIAVRASRVDGQGSQILRRQVLERILRIVGL